MLYNYGGTKARYSDNPRVMRTFRAKSKPQLRHLPIFNLYIYNIAWHSAKFFCLCSRFMGLFAMQGSIRSRASSKGLVWRSYHLRVNKGQLHHKTYKVNKNFHWREFILNKKSLQFQKY